VEACDVANIEDDSLNNNPAALSGTFGSQALGALISADALSVSRVGLLRSRDSVSFQVTASPKVVLAVNQALVEDVITIDFAPFRGQTGLLFVQYQLSGNVSNNGPARAFAEVSVVARTLNVQRFPALHASSGGGIFRIPTPINFIYGQPFILGLLLNTVAGTASPHANGIGFDPFVSIGKGTARADFSNTLALVALDVTDSNGNPLPSPPTFSSVSGASYSADGILNSFSEFTAHVEPGISATTFEAEGVFGLGSSNNGIAPLNEDVTLQVGTFSASIEAGSFTQRSKNLFKFEGVVNGQPLEMSIHSLPDGRFKFNAEGVGADLTTQPVTVRLIIGDDGGKATATADK
jgi:hypothetical protein